MSLVNSRKEFIVLAVIIAVVMLGHFLFTSLVQNKHQLEQKRQVLERQQEEAIKRRTAAQKAEVVVGGSPGAPSVNPFFASVRQLFMGNPLTKAKPSAPPALVRPAAPAATAPQPGKTDQPGPPESAAPPAAADPAAYYSDPR